jgi:small-conductance mechanosensitive channel
LLLGALGWGLGKALQIVVRKVLEQGALRTKTDLDDRLIKLLSAPIIQTTVTLALIVAVTAFEERTAFNQVTIRILVTLLLFFWARAWLKATHLALEAMSKNVRSFELFQPRTVPLFEMGIKIVLVVVFAYFFMQVWGIDGTAWLASAGIIGIAVGFAARDTLANLISGVSIVADAPYKIGDYIVLDTGERGIVTSLGIRSTRLLTRDDVEISIPNAVIGNAKITNESGGPWVKQRLRVPVGVAYGTDTEKVVKVLEGVARDNPDIVERPEPRVRMRAFGQSSLDFELLGWIDHPEDRGRVCHDLLIAIDTRFREAGIVIPFPQRDVHVHYLEGKSFSEPNLPDEDSADTTAKEDGQPDRA